MSSSEKNSSRGRRGLTWAVALLLLFGAVRAPLEYRLGQAYRTAFFHGARLDLGMRQQIGQSAFLAALGGFRAAVAQYLWIQAHIDWTRTEWGKMYFLFNNVTALQPRDQMFWDMSAWHMAYNASVAALNDTTVPRMALRLRHQHEYFVLGRDLLERGIANNPDRPKLYESLANLLRDKFDDHCEASRRYAEAARLPGVMTYVKRFAAYQLALCPGREREAYADLVRLYNLGEQEHLPTLMRLIHDLQEKLNLPQDKRIRIKPGDLPPDHPPGG